MYELGRQPDLERLWSQGSATVRNCPICRSSNWRYFGGRNHFGIRLLYWICKNCLLVAQSPRLDDRRIEEFYELCYRRLTNGTMAPVAEEVELQERRAENLLEIFSRTTSINEVRNILDFGCSAGRLLRVAKRRLKAGLLVGVEIDQNYAALAKHEGAFVYTNIMEVSRAHQVGFDLVTMSHVLEHLADIVGVLRNIRQVLKVGGYILIEVPHSCEGACFQVGHLWGFNESSLSKLLEECGFNVITMTTHGYPRMPSRKKLYLVALAKRDEVVRPYTFNSSLLKEIAKRRQVQHPDLNGVKYHAFLFKNTVKQLLGAYNTTPCAYSYFPTKMKVYRRMLSKGER